MISDSVITVDRLSRHYGPFRAVDEVSFSVQRGEIFGYLGANGAGKSTTIRMLCGLLQPTSGEARVAGCSISTNPEGVKSSIGYMSQKFSLYLDLTAMGNMEFFGGAYGISRREIKIRSREVMELIGLTGMENATTGDMPFGLRQRLALGCAILHRPQIVFLDEPTAGVDPASRRSFWRLIRSMAKEGTTVFVTTHYMDEAEYCGRIGMMVAGSLVALDTPQNLKRDFVPGILLNLQGRGISAAVATLAEHPGILATEPFGAGYHLRFDPSHWSEEGVEKVLLAAGVEGLQVERSEANLEDVFLALAGQTSPSPT